MEIPTVSTLSSFSHRLAEKRSKEGFSRARKKADDNRGASYRAWNIQWRLFREQEHGKRNRRSAGSHDRFPRLSAAGIYRDDPLGHLINVSNPRARGERITRSLIQKPGLIVKNGGWSTNRWRVCISGTGRLLTVKRRGYFIVYVEWEDIPAIRINNLTIVERSSTWHSFVREREMAR